MTDDLCIDRFTGSLIHRFIDFIGSSAPASAFGCSVGRPENPRELHGFIEQRFRRDLAR
jgi:hypothetical protein